MLVLEFIYIYIYILQYLGSFIYVQVFIEHLQYER